MATHYLYKTGSPPSADEMADATVDFDYTTTDLIIRNLEHPETRHDLPPVSIMNTDEQTVRETLTLDLHCDRATGPATANTHHLIGIIRGLHQYDRYKNVPLETLTGTELAIAAALINITSAIHRYYEKPEAHLRIINPDDPATSLIYLKDPTAVETIIKHHHRTDDLIWFLSARTTSIAAHSFTGLPRLRWYKKQALDSVTDDTITTALNYLRVTEELQVSTRGEHVTRIQNGNKKPTFIDSPELEQFIEQNPDLIDDLIDYIEDRNNADLERFREHMNNPSSLREGAL